MGPQDLEASNNPHNRATSSIHESDTNSNIKSKINKKPFLQDAQEEYSTTKKVKIIILWWWWNWILKKNLQLYCENFIIFSFILQYLQWSFSMQR